MTTTPDRTNEPGTGYLEIRINGITQRPKVFFEIENDPSMSDEEWAALVHQCTSGSMFMVTGTRALPRIEPGDFEQ